jgi:hypothetical protein
VLINNNATMQHHHLTPQPNYPGQQWAPASAFHRPTPSPVRRQETLTQCDWGARPIPAGWREARDGTGTKFYINKRTNTWAPTYEHMFVDEEPSPPPAVLTQRSASNSNSQEEESGSQAGTPRKKKRRKEVEVIEVGTEQLPGSDFSLDLAQRREARNDEDKENVFENANQNEKGKDSDEEDKEEDAEEDDEGDEGSSQETTWPARQS